MPTAKPTTTSLLFMDLLGSKAIWMKDGAEGAAAAFDEFARLVASALDRNPTGVISAGVESDSAAVICKNAVAAVRLGIEIYHQAFVHSAISQDRLRRTWIRGVVIPADGVASVDSLRTTVDRAHERLHVSTLSPVLLDAIAMEKSGFRGMRLLADGSLLSKSDRYQIRDHLDCSPLVPVRRLKYSTYPERMGEFEDILWMGSCDEERMVRRRRRMASRMRWAARDADEILQAAATQVVFDECAELLRSARDREVRSEKTKEAVRPRPKPRNSVKVTTKR
jgi:hypothetical protein